MAPPSQKPMLTRSNRRDRLATGRLSPSQVVSVQGWLSAISGTSAGFRLSFKHVVFIT
jgi:hypothetical protein